MTVATTSNRDEFVGDGLLTLFDFTFVAYSVSQIKVEIDGQEVTTGFTISRNSNNIGGTVTFDTAPASGIPVVIYREIPLTQILDLVRYGRFPAESIERALDEGVMIDQQLHQRDLELAEEIEASAAGILSKVLNLADGNNIMQQNIDMDNHRILDVADPSDEQDAVNLRTARTLVAVVKGANFVQEDVPTVGLEQGVRWYKPSDNEEYIYYVDTNGNGLWTETTDVGDNSSALTVESEGGVPLQTLIDATQFENVEALQNYPWLNRLEGRVVEVQGYYQRDVGAFRGRVLKTADVAIEDIDAIQSTTVPTYSVLPIKATQTNIADIREFGGLTGEVNDQTTHQAFMKAVRFLERQGGGSLFIYPDIPNQDYFVDDEVTITANNIKLHLYTNIRLTYSDGTDPRSCIAYRGVSTADSVQGAKVYGNGFLIDGNGVEQDSNGYVFTAGEGYHSLLMKYCKRPYVEDITLTNGLVDSGKALRCVRPYFKRVIMTGAVHDNGMTFSQDPDNYDVNDKSTWCNGIAEDCEAYNNEDFGMTSFNASGCLFINPTSERNGTDTSPHGDNGTGHAGGGMSLEAQDNKSTYCKIIDGRLRSNTTSGITVTAKGCELVNTNVNGVTLNEAKPDIALYRGHAVALLGGDLKISGGSYKGANRAGVYGLAAVLGSAGFVLVETLSIEGNCEISGNGNGGIDARGVQNVSVSEEVRVFDNQASNGQIYIHNNPGTTYNYNDGFGHAIVRAQVDSTDNASVRVTNLKKADVKISGDSTVAVEPIICNNVEKVVTVGNIITNETGNLPPNLILVTNCDEHFYWSNRGNHSGGKAVNSTATTQLGTAQALSDAAGWADATAQAKFNTLLERLRDSGDMSQ